MQKVDSLIFVTVAILMLIGAIFAYSLPVFLELNKHLSQYHFFLRYIAFSALGFGIMVLLSRLEPEKWFNKIGFGILIISGALVIILPFLPESIAPVINGAKRWIKLGPVKFSPVEFFKLGVVFFLAWSFTRKVKKSKTLKEELKIIIPYLIFLGIFWVLIIFLLSDLGQVMVMAIIFALMLFVAGGRLQTFGLFGLIGLLMLVPAIIFAPYRLHRLKNWLYTFTSNFFPKPLVDGSSSSYYQVVTSLKAIHHGGIEGVGIGNGIFKLGFLSDVHTDFVLAGIAEEAGVIGITIVLFLLTFLIFRIFKVSFRSEKKEYELFAFGIGSLVAIQLIINGLGVTSIIPIKGLTVPFLSYGGSSLIAFCFAMGMVLMISKRAKL
ncbi:MAG: cell division protein FtsW [Epsilonproteobacteria bacterium]|nr:cell division protein FtsW [Campylobacterota bacterium]